MSTISSIEKRVSWRKFKKESLEVTVRNELLNFATNLGCGPFGGQIRPKLLTNQEEDSYKKLGSYGMIRGATDYFCGVIPKGERDLEDFGFLTEKVVLKATELGLASCWLGGSFTKGTFAMAVDQSESEILPAVIALGIPTDKRGLIDSLVRRGAKSNTRRPFEDLFFKDNFQTPMSNEGDIGRALSLVQMAPSASNRQPWRVLCDDQGLHFFLERGEKYQKTLKRFKLFDLQRTDMGIAMAHFDVAARELNICGNFAKDEARFSDIPSGTEYILSWFLNLK